MPSTKMFANYLQMREHISGNKRTCCIGLTTMPPNVNIIFTLQMTSNIVPLE